MVGSVVWVCENTLRVMFGRKTWLYSDEQRWAMLISPSRVNLA